MHTSERSINVMLKPFDWEIARSSVLSYRSSGAEIEVLTHGLPVGPVLPKTSSCSLVHTFVHLRIKESQYQFTLGFQISVGVDG